MVLICNSERNIDDLSIFFKSDYAYSRTKKRVVNLLGSLGSIISNSLTMFSFLSFLRIYISLNILLVSTSSWNKLNNFFTATLVPVGLCIASHTFP